MAKKTLKDRPRYISQLQRLKENGLVKVLVGMRRCGKSSILELFASELTASGVEKDQIVCMNFESAELMNVSTSNLLVEWLRDKTPVFNKDDGRTIYVLLDEIQLVSGWERAINAMRLEGNVDIYLTGSNAYLLSSQLATLLSGRYVEVKVYPLSFSEFIEFTNTKSDPETAFSRYIKFGGLPPVVEQGANESLAQMVLSGIYDTVFVKDIAQHIQVRNTSTFNDIAGFLADTGGSSVSIRNIERRLENAHRKTSNETIERYIQALVDAFLLYRVKREDLRGGSILQGLEKYYLADLGIRNMLLKFPKRNYGFILENATINELICRGFRVYVGKGSKSEIDFVATRGDETKYIQVCASVLDDQTRTRELDAFRAVPPYTNADGANKPEKLILTYDRLGLGDFDDIRIMNVIDWMLEE